MLSLQRVKRVVEAITKSAYRRAWEMREEQDGIAPLDSWISEERWKNNQKYTLVNLNEVVSVMVSGTMDTRHITITLTDVDGNHSTIWCASGEVNRTIPVRAITSY